MALILTVGCGDDPAAEPDVDAAASDVGVGDVAIDASDVGDADDAVTDAELSGDVADSSVDSAVDSPPDAVPDSTEDATDADVTPLTVPFVPPPIGEPRVDAPFLQEWNHTTPEVDARIGALVDVVLRPSDFAAWNEFVLVTPRGLVRGTSDESVDLVSIPTDDADLIGAGRLATGALVVASGRTAYVVAADGALSRFGAPEGIAIERVVDGVDRVWLLTSGGASAVTVEGVEWTTDGPHIVALAEDAAGVVVASEGSLARWPRGAVIGEGPPTWALVNAVDPEYEALVLDVSLPEPLDVVAFHRDGALGVRETTEGGELVAVPIFAADRVPLRGAREAIRTGDGGFVAVGSEGAWRIMDRGDGPEWRVYPAERWLPSEDVRGVATRAEDALSELHFATAGGHAHVTATMMTLEEKLEYFVERIVARHDRDGAVADSHLTVRGDLSSSIPWDSDNDGGWTAYWLIAECARWTETGAEDARANFDHSLERMLSLQTLTGTDTFLARAVIRREGCMLDDCDDPDDGEWFRSPDDAWWVKGDTSNDEVISHMFMMGPAYDWCATDVQRDAIAQHVTRIVGGIIDNGWQLVDLDGEVTRYGQFDPQYINVTISGRSSDGGRRSAAALGMAALAYHVSGEARFVEAAQVLMDEHHYHDNALIEADYPLRWGQYSGDNNELSMQAWMALVRYETDPALHAMWLEGWSKTYAGLVEQEGAMWDVAHYMLGGDVIELDHIVRWLRLAPMDFIRWSIHNGHRRDLVRPSANYDRNGRMRSDGRPMPYDERANDRWNTDQYHIDNGFNGWVEMDGADVLTPYWLARHYGLIVPE